MRYSTFTTAILTLSLAVAATGCHNKDDVANDNAAASAAAASAPPMSAAPADSKGTPAAVNETNAAVDAGPDANASVSADTPMAASEVTASDVAPEGGADNSGMDKISENDQVIDNEPASPNAPRAADEGEAAPNENLGNAKVGK